MNVTEINQNIILTNIQEETEKVHSAAAVTRKNSNQQQQRDHKDYHKSTLLNLHDLFNKTAPTLNIILVETNIRKSTAQQNFVPS